MASSCQQEECTDSKDDENGQGGAWARVKVRELGSRVERQMAIAGGYFLNSRVGLDS